MSLLQLSHTHNQHLTSLLSEFTVQFQNYARSDTQLNRQQRSKDALAQLAVLAHQDQQLYHRLQALELELAESTHTQEAAVASHYSLEARLTQALKDCQGLSTSSATMRAQQRKSFDRVQELEHTVQTLTQQLKNSVPAEKVQSVLEAAAQRVSGICDGAAKSQQDLDRAKREIKRLQTAVESFPTLVEEKTREEVRQRKRSDMLAKEATKRADKLERKLIELEQSTNQLRNMLKSAKEGIGVMKTIARIRNADGGGGGQGGSGGGRSIGFDAVANTIDGVSRQVDARVQRKKKNTGKKRSGSGGFGSVGRGNRKKDVFANMVNG